jgi:hypothetical protein
MGGNSFGLYIASPPSENPTEVPSGVVVDGVPPAWNCRKRRPVELDRRKHGSRKSEPPGRRTTSVFLSGVFEGKTGFRAIWALQSVPAPRLFDIKDLFRRDMPITPF